MLGTNAMKRPESAFFLHVKLVTTYPYFNRRMVVQKSFHLCLHRFVHVGKKRKRECVLSHTHYWTPQRSSWQPRTWQDTALCCRNRSHIWEEQLWSPWPRREEEECTLLKTQTTSSCICTPKTGLACAVTLLQHSKAFLSFLQIAKTESRLRVWSSLRQSHHVFCSNFLNHAGKTTHCEDTVVSWQQLYESN